MAEAIVRIGVPCNAQLGRACMTLGARLSRRSPQLRVLDTLMQGVFARNQEAHVNLDEIAALVVRGRLDALTLWIDSQANEVAATSEPLVGKHGLSIRHLVPTAWPLEHAPNAMKENSASCPIRCSLVCVQVDGVIQVDAQALEFMSQLAG
jgi:hypothetical protein